jgi:hypothetical protein
MESKSSAGQGHYRDLPIRGRLKLGHQAFALMAITIVLGFLTLLISFLRWPPSQGFRVFVAQETAKIALQLIGVTFVGFLVTELVRRAREKDDFARRARAAYGKAKARRRRLRWLSPEERLKELELLNDIQLEFEDLKEEAEQKFGPRHEIVTNLEKIEKYLHDVVNAGLPKDAHAVSGGAALKDFVAEYEYEKGSRFDTDFKKAYRAVRKGLGLN